MAHLHVPDGVLPVWLWSSAWGLAVLLLVLTARSGQARHPRHAAYRGALGAVVLAAMAVEIPLGPLEFHVTLLGPLGVLLGPAAAFQVTFVASAMLAFLGHGGFTVIGLNSLVLGAGAALARPVYRALLRGRTPAAALSLGAAAAQTLAGLLWLAVMAAALHARAWADPHGAGAARFGWVAAIALPVWVLGIAIEAAIAGGVARFLDRVRPDLLPAPAEPEPRALRAAP